MVRANTKTKSDAGRRGGARGHPQSARGWTPSHRGRSEEKKIGSELSGFAAGADPKKACEGGDKNDERRGDTTFVVDIGKERWKGYRGRLSEHRGIPMLSVSRMEKVASEVHRNSSR